MTLVEFLTPVLRSGRHIDRVLAVLYFSQRYEGAAAITAEQVRSKLRGARVRNAHKMNVPDVLAKSGEFVDIAGQLGRAKLWKLTDAGAAHVRQVLALPDADAEIEHDVGSLAQLVGKLSDEVARGYLDEGLKCLQVGALKACVVFVWAGTIRTIQERLLAKGSATVTAALGRHDPKARTVSTMDDFAYSKETHQLQIAQDLGLIDKGQKSTLGEALDLRNRCGHPSKYNPGVKKVSSFLEDVVGIVFA